MRNVVVTGRAGSGKSRYLMDRIRVLLENPLEKIIVIVPAALTFETEKAIMQSCGVKGILGLEVLSIQRLCHRIFEQTGRISFLTPAERAVACRRALAALDFPFGSPGPDMDVRTAELITRLKSHCQTPGSLRGAAEALSDAALARKLRAAADVLAVYDELCAGRLDSADMYVLAARRAEAASFLRGAHLVIDGLDSVTPAVMQLLEKVMRQAQSVAAAFRDAGGGADEAVFAPETRACTSFMQAAQRAGKPLTQIRQTQKHARHERSALKFLEANLYRYPYTPYAGEPEGVRIVETQSLEQEVKTVAAMILHEIRHGRRFRDIAVIGNGLDAYLPALKSTFALCGIPLFVDVRRTLADNAFFDFLYKALCAAAGDMTAVTGYIYSDYAPLDEKRRARLFAYAQRYAYKGWHYMKKFWRGDDAAEAEAARAAVMKPLERLTAALAEGCAQTSVAAVKRFLNDCGVPEKLERLCASVDAPDTRAECAYFRQVLDKSLETLDGIARVCGDGALDAQTLCDMVRTGFEATGIAVIPPTTDAVGVYDLKVARLPDVDVLFAIGVHDGVWPARDDGPGLISALERDTLAQNGLDIGVFDLAAEKLDIYGALTKPKNQLVLSYNTQTGQPSVLIDRLLRLFPRLAVETPQTAVTSLQGMEADVLGALAGALRGKQPQEDVLQAVARYLKQPGWRQTAQTLLLRDNAAMALDTDTAVALYGGIRCSATRIENYYRCPYRHFLDHGIRVRAQRDYVYDRVDIGSFLHFALDLFARALIETGTDIKTLSEAQTATLMEDTVQRAMREHDNAKLLEDERLSLQAAVLRRELVDTALRIRAHFLDSQANLYASEQSFAFKVPTAFGDVEITGKIDRIDAADGYFRVVDYKSSTTKFSLNELAQGTSLQLPVYIEAARQLLAETGLRPAGGYYMRIGEKLGGSEDEVEKNARLQGLSLNDAQVLRCFSAVHEGGNFVAIDQSVTKAGKVSTRGAGRLFTAQELDALLDYTCGKIRSAAERIYEGDTSICPSGTDVCGFCNYGSICRMNVEYAGNAVRETEKFDRACLTGEESQ